MIKRLSEELILISIVLLIIGGIVIWSINSQGIKRCSDFDNPLDAQEWSDKHSYILDRDRDGLACEDLWMDLGS